MSDDLAAVAKYLFEAGELKRIKRSGWWLAKVKDPESVAEHSFRTAVVVLILARMEGMNDTRAQKLCTAAVFHDMHESRILDIHKVAARYLANENAGKNAEADQIAALPPAVRDSVRKLYALSPTEKTILKDADLLEMCLQAKEYMEIGYADCADWIRNSEKKLRTKSAKILLTKLKRMRSREWWKDLKRLD